ncbi:granzyme K-like [Megalops cyprinoides]|uniref:granzyme K-like n=1 Tax=Megalops cyprinoides TaxID=118141 RepID=UPI0018651D74|nr:granzyme K-like [Megalops cyprinoides]
MHPLAQTALTFLYISSTWKSAACSGMGIVGGKEVKPHSSPWMVSIQCNNHHFCGGTLIKDQWVLTAAHCKRQCEKPASMTVLLGAHSLTKEKDTVRMGIEKPFIPGTFSLKTKADDIMLIKLEKRVKTKGKKIKVKDLPKDGKDVPVGTSCQVTGWGRTRKEANEASDTLRGVEVKIEDRDLCRCLYNKNPMITEDMLCAGNKKTKADACQGDSGGPLVCKKALVGIVSGGYGCGDPKKPGVYTRLSKKHLSWIKSIIKNQYNTTISEGYVSPNAFP